MGRTDHASSLVRPRENREVVDGLISEPELAKSKSSEGFSQIRQKFIRNAQTEGLKRILVGSVKEGFQRIG